MISIKEAFSYSARLSGAGFVGGALTAAVQILVARRLGPEGLGVVGLVQLFLLYASLARPGILQAGYREMLHCLGKDDAEEAKRLEGVALTGEAAALSVAFMSLILLAVFWPGDSVVRTALAIGAVTYLANSLYQFVDTIQWAYHRFTLAARVNTLVKLSQPVFLFCGLYAFGLYGVLAAPLATASLALVYYLTRTKGLHHTYAWDRPELIRLLKAGIPLSIYGLSYWGLRSADRALAARLLDLRALGYYTFAVSLLNQACQWVSDFVNVLQASLLSELGRHGRVRPLAWRLKKLQIGILMVTGAAASAAHVCVAPFVLHLVPKFSPAIPAFETMTLLFPAITAPLLSATVILSTVVDRPGLLTAIQFLSLAVNLALGAVLLSFGWGLEGIAWASFLSQCGTAAGAMAILHRFLFEDAQPREPARYYAWNAGILALCAGAHFALRATAGTLDGTTGAFVGFSVTVAVWSAAAVLYKKHWMGATSDMV